MDFLILLSALFLYASASASDKGVTHWWSEPTARPTIDASKCSEYSSLFGHCRTIQYGFETKTEINTMALDTKKHCSMLAHSWASIYKVCGNDKTGLPETISHPGATATPALLPHTEIHALDARKKKPKPTCNIEGDSPFETCRSDKRDSPDDIEEDTLFSEPLGPSEEQKRDPKKKKPKPPCNIENDSPFKTCDSEKRDDVNSIEHKSESAMAKRDQHCPQDYHFLTAEHDTYDYYFCCPDAMDKMLLPASYAAAPKCCMKSDKKCTLDAVDSLDGCRDPGSEVTQYGGVIGCRDLATKKGKREAFPGSISITAGHDPVTSLGPDSDLHPTTYPTAPPDHGQYCHLGGCGKGQVTSYVDGLFCQCVPAPPPTPTTVTVHDPVTGFIRNVAGRDAEHTQSEWHYVPVPPTATVGTITVTITVPAPTTMSTAVSPSTTGEPSTKQDSLKALGQSKLT